MKDINKKYIIIAQPRSGSTLITRALARHPQVDSHPEIFLKMVNGDWEEKTDEEKMETVHKFMEKQGVAGFKVMLVQAPFPFYDFLAEHQIKIIYITRDDLVRQTISTEVANITNEWFDVVHKKKFELDPKRVLELVRGLKRMRDWFESEHLPRYKNVLRLKYTDLVGEEGAEITQIPYPIAKELCDFLEVDYQSLTVSMPKQGKKNLDEVISNWVEVESFLMQNGVSVR